MAPAKKKSGKGNSGRRKKTDSAGARSLLYRLFRWCLVIGLWSSLVLGTIVAWYAIELPQIIDTPQLVHKNAITVKSREGNVIARYGDLKGVRVPVSELPAHLVYAVLAIEDRRFYQHPGVDPIGIARAMAANLMRGHVSQGGSTITQQLAKNLFLSPARTFKRKVQEALLALWLEHNLTKDEILSAYLNRVYMGSNAYGVEAASEVYFGKSAKDLNLREAATIAGLLKAPSRYSPLANPRLSAERANVVLHAMADAGYITEAEARNLTDIPPAPGKKPLEANAIRYYTDWVTKDIDLLIGSPELDITVSTTLDPDIQDAAERALATHLRNEGADKKVSQGAVVVLGYDGAVLAMVGGYDYQRSQFNRAVDARRQPGSSFKPFVYLTALMNGYTPETMMLDQPITEGKYRPANYGNEYYGEIPLRYALAFSLNTVAVRLAQDVSVQNIIQTARAAGIRANLHPDLSLALGTAEVPMIEMVNGYATIARGGLYLDPYAVTAVHDKDGRLLYQRSNAIPARRTLDANAVSELRGMMELAIREGTAKAAQGPYYAAGKTGTTQDFRDAWFIGFTDRYIAAVWVGNDDNSPTKHVTGGTIPAQIWRDTMTVAQRKHSGFVSSFFNAGNDNSYAYEPARPVADFQGAHAANDNNARNNDRTGDNFNNFLRSFLGGKKEEHEDTQRYND